MEFGDEVIKILNYLCEKIGVTIDWTNDNALPYLKVLCGKYVKWETQTSIAWIVIALVSVVLAFITAFIIHKHCNFDIFDNFEWWVFACAVIIAMIVICTQVFDIIECNTFPEKAIYDYIKMEMGSTGH